MTKEAEESNVDVASEQTDETPEKTYSEKEVEELTEAARKAEFDKNNDQLSRVGAENKRLRSQQEQPKTAEPNITSKVLDLMETGDDYENPDRKAKIRQLREETTRQEQMGVWESRVAQEKNKVIQKIEEAGQNPNDESFDKVWDAFEIATYSGKFETVDSRLDRVISKSKPKEKEKEAPLDLDNLTKEQWEVVERKVMDKRGETNDDSGGSSGGMSDEKWLDEVYGKGKSDDHERAEKILNKLK